MKIGYMRCSTDEQNLDLQRDALKKAGCDRIFEDVASGAIDTRPGLQQAIEFARSGDTITVWRLDRLGRSLRHLIEVVTDLEKRNIGLCSLTENINTGSAGGRLVFHIFGSLAEFERQLIKDRTMAGLAAARERGRIGGRPSVMDERKIALAKTLIKDQTSVDDICRALQISRASFYRHFGGEK
ncbi:MAG: recombinase family protein [Oligoflexales bacterium]|nr:recombinase family protein [Oligoflexales bacterium]